MKIRIVPQDQLQFTDPRMELAYHIARRTSLRSREFRTLRLDQVLNTHGEVKTVISVRVKGSKRQPVRHREVYLPTGLRERIANYIATHKPELRGPYLFPGHRARVMPASTMHKLWHQAQAGMDNHLRVHDIRHTAVTEYYNLTKDMEKARQFAGHRSILTTQRYTHIRPEEVWAEQERVFGHE